ncbi:MAG TPA: type II toxin-antitoxin system VapC family toxin [Thermoleophilia bacterium]|nr:type II toxin-antitoxin system VapC family toxin [Thermoleophilia bacterium]
MGLLVLDCSVTMSWLFREEFTPFAERILDEVTASRAVVPSLWPLEVGSVLLQAERRGRVSEADGSRFLALLGGLQIDVDALRGLDLLHDVVPLARATGLTAYDASYLELAARFGVPLATLDRRLAAAASRVGVALCE